MSKMACALLLRVMCFTDTQEAESRLQLEQELAAQRAAEAEVKKARSDVGGSSRFMRWNSLSGHLLVHLSLCRRWRRA